MKQAIIRAKGSDITEVLIYDMIGDDLFGDGIDAKAFRSQLKAVKTPVINLRINSPGGSVIEAAAMLTALDEHPARIEVDVDGLAASAASVLMTTGDVVRVARDSLVMIHNPHLIAAGGADDMRRAADLLDKVQSQMADRYAGKTGKKASRTKVMEWMAAETWFTGEEAVAAGLADQVSGSVRMAARARFGPVLAKLGCHHVPPALLAAQAQADNPLALEVGDTVQWLEIDAEELTAELRCGCIEEIDAEGVGIPGTALTLAGTPEDPAVRVCEKEGEECCWYLLRASQLREEEGSELEVPAAGAVMAGQADASIASATSPEVWAEHERRKTIAANL